MFMPNYEALEKQYGNTEEGRNLNTLGDDITDLELFWFN